LLTLENPILPDSVDEMTNVLKNSKPDVMNETNPFWTAL